MIGIDEVGRGAWAGPLLVCAARVKKGKKLPQGLTDSKLLTKKQRNELLPLIVDSCEIGEGWVSAEMIDKLGLSRAIKSACLLATFQLTDNKNEKITLDGNYNLFTGTSYKNVTVLPKADILIPIVSAASIYAKVKRDLYMQELAEDISLYGFEKHVGYGTKAHRMAIQNFGPSMQHRMSFRPMKDL